jgi:hypothetical protein
LDTILYDLNARNGGKPLILRASCHSPESHEVQLKFGGTESDPKVLITFTLIDGELFIDVIDMGRLEEDDVPCGALASLSAKLRVGHDELVEEDDQA